MTSQRLKILQHLRDAENHPTAEMVYREISKELPSITLATVYRNLNLLAEDGELLRLEVGDVFRYDGRTMLHQHGVCKNCGRIVDIFRKGMSENALRRANRARSDGFRADSVSIMFSGYCKQCIRGE